MASPSQQEYVSQDVGDLEQEKYHYKRLEIWHHLLNRSMFHGDREECKISAPDLECKISAPDSDTAETISPSQHTNLITMTDSWMTSSEKLSTFFRVLNI